MPEADATPPPPAGRRGRRVDWRFAFTLAVGVGGGLLLAALVQRIFGALEGLFTLLLVSLFLSFAMEPAVQWMHRRGMRRGAATGLVFLAMILLIAGFVAAMAPLIIGQIRNLVEAGPEVLEDLADRADALPGNLGDSISSFLEEQRRELPARLPDLAGTIGRRAADVGTTLLGGVLQALAVALVTFYLVADGPRLRRTLSGRLPPERQREFLRTWEVAIEKTGGYVYSRALTAVASAAFHIVAFVVIDIPYPYALGAWVGLVSSLIPVIGTYLAGTLPVLIALATPRPLSAVWVLLAIVVYQQVENYLVAPRITAATMQLHPAVAFLAVLAGGAVLGAVGALLALPVAAIVQALISTYLERHEVVEHEMVGPSAPVAPDG